MSNQTIPEAAVEAAARAVYTRQYSSREGMWEFVEERVRRHFRNELRAALAAAAPHMRELQWGVRDRHSLMIAGHPSEESARAIAAEHPEWYEVVSRPTPGLWTAK